MKVQRNGRKFTVEVTADGEGVVSHAGTALLAETADRIGLTDALSRGLAPMRERRGAHDPGRVVRDLAVMLASGGCHLADLRAVRDQEALFGAVASDATAWRTIEAIARDPELLGALRAARRAGREGAWAAGAEPEGPLFVDLDPTLIEAGSEKQGAAPTFKKGFGFHPVLAFLDRPADACGGEPLAGLLRPGNAGANTVADQIEVAEEALEQLPADIAADSEIVLRFDSAGATHGLLDWAREGRIRFSVGFDLTEPVREAISRIPDQRWVSALAQDDSPRKNGEVAEAGDLIDLSGWPEGSRLIVRRERPHPGAQLSFTDRDGHRFQAILTDRTGDAAGLERDHRARARCEDRIRCSKEMGLELLPFNDFAMNAVWMELVLIAGALIAWADLLLLRGELSGLEPKRLRYRALHTAGRLAFHARQATLRLERRWPWAEELAAAFTRLSQLPVPAG
jgi:hypothetical protein